MYDDDPDGLEDLEVGAMAGLTEEQETVHRCPPKGSGIMPCCDKTPFEVPRTDRMTVDPALVTCGGQQ